MDEFAVGIDSLGFSYSRSNPVLKDVTIHVPKGQVYSLLGSNGSGKTTLLNILLGRLRQNKGSISVFGRKMEPGGAQLRHMIGFMPQEIALDRDLDIEETFFYFARVNHVRNREYVLKRIGTYLQMLGLSNPKQFVHQLSGGQQRLLSLGVTLIYEPKILLLDEPTVGVDSLIRKSIWNHLNQICQQKQTTVIITTHYIDEAKQSNLVGFLKDGHLLAEQSPSILMSQLGCATLEEVFYRLCLWQNKALPFESSEHFRYGKDAQNNNTNNTNAVFPVVHYSGEETVKVDTASALDRQGDKGDLNLSHNKALYCSKGLLNMEHMQALACREWTLFRSNLTNFILLVTIPLITVILFQSSYGRTPTNVPVAIVNSDRGLASSSRISEIYLKSFNTSMVKMSFFNDEDEAFETVKQGKNVMLVAFRSNFSNAFISRYSMNGPLGLANLYDDDDPDSFTNMLSDSSIHTYMDMSRVLNVRYLNRSVLMAFHKMVQEYGKMNGQNPYLFSTPIETKQIYYGTLEPNLQDLFQAGIIVIVLVAMSVILGLRMINTRNNGVLERDLNQGIKPIELLLTYQMAPLVPVMVQVLVTLLVSFYVVGIRLEGNFWAAYVLVFVTAYQGIFIGTLISVFCRSQISSLIVSFSLLVIMFFTGGILWPVEGMPNLVQKVFLVNPIMLPIQSLRCIMLRGWNYTHFQVLIGYISTFATCAGLFLLESVLFHFSVRSVK